MRTRSSRTRSETVSATAFRFGGGIDSRTSIPSTPCNCNSITIAFQWTPDVGSRTPNQRIRCQRILKRGTDGHAFQLAEAAHRSGAIDAEEYVQVKFGEAHKREKRAFEDSSPDSPYVVHRSDPARIRTWDLRIRNPTLYPTELRDLVASESPLRLAPGGELLNRFPLASSSASGPFDVARISHSF